MVQVAFCIPSTTNKRDWKTIHETYLLKILLPTLSEMKSDCNIKVFIGYDEDDKIYSEHRINKYKDIEIDWTSFDSSFKGNPVGIWNVLAEKSIKAGFDYLMILGDDITIPQDNWLDRFIVNLNIRDNIGFSAGWSNNDNIPTQFLINKKHIEIFNWVYPPLLKNWFCDDFMYNIYPYKYRYWDKDVKLLNVGGEPRYNPNNDKNLCDRLLKRYKKNLCKYIK